MLRLRIRRRQRDSVYADCPICGDKRGKMNINLVKNVFRCNYCGESGGMIALRAKTSGTSNAEAYHDILKALGTNRAGDSDAYIARTNLSRQSFMLRETWTRSAIPNAEPASEIDIHGTLTAMLDLLVLSRAHRAQLQERGLSDACIERFGYKSTPRPDLCLSLTNELIKQGRVVRGVPGFYIRGDGKWTVRFNPMTAGVLIPIRGYNGLMKGAQIRLDSPIKDKNEKKGKGTKYLWHSSSGKHMGVTSGSPAHFVGDRVARTVYVTEGGLKADVAYCLTSRTFVAVAGASNTGQLGVIFSMLAKNGVRLIIEALDMDKRDNAMVEKGAARILELARESGMEARRLTWDPTYKGIDDWQLAIKRSNAIAV